MKKFSVMFLITVDDNNNILSSHDSAHESDIEDLINDVMYDVDDVEVENVTVKER